MFAPAPAPAEHVGFGVQTLVGVYVGEAERAADVVSAGVVY